VAICYSSSATYTLTNVPAGANITWSASDANHTVIPNPGGLSAVVTNTSPTSTLANVSASINGCSGQLTASTTVALGIPFLYGGYTNTYDGSNNPIGYYPGITNNACTGYYINTTTQLIGVASSGPPAVQWSKISSSGVVNFNQTGNDISFYLFATGENVIFKLAASNSCGTLNDEFKWQATNCSGSGGGGGGCYAFTVSPNPARGNVTVSIPTILPPCNLALTSGNASLTASSMVIKEIRVYDNLKVLKTIVRSNNKQVNVDLPHLSPGVYFVEIVGSNNYKETQKIIVQR
jgi:hypothetical protein